MRYRILIIACAALLLALMLWGLTAGAAQLSPLDAAQILLIRLSGGDPVQSGFSLASSVIVWDIRLPRVLSGMLCGAALAVSGAIFQSLLLSPLADAYTMGSSSGAAFGAVLGLYLSMALGIPISPTACAFGMALLTLLIVLTASKGASGTHSLIMAGVIVGSIMSAGVSFVKVLAGDMIGSVSIFLIGSLASVGMDELLILALATLAGGACAYVGAYRLNIMTLGECEAQQLGVNTSAMRIFFCIVATALTASCVAVCGTIGFVGLIVPHVARRLLGSDNRRIIPVCMLGGAALLLGADTVSRVLLPRELPVGVMTTLLGGPFFLWLFICGKRKEAL